MAGCRPPEGVEQMLQGCAAICSSKRLLDTLPGIIERISPKPAVIPITPLSGMLQGISEYLERGNVGVLASGDPLFFGIGRRLLSAFGKDHLEFHPALSSVQLACAKLRISWDNAAVMSLHGRKEGQAAGRILSARKTILFTDKRNSPDMVAGQLLEVLKRAGDAETGRFIRIHVAENLLCPGERIRSMSAREAAAASFSPLNIMIVEIDEKVPLPSRGTGLMEDEIRHLRGLITKNEIRAIVLHKLRLEPGSIVWDIGAGSGSVSIEAARLYQEITSYAVEADEQQQQIIRENISALRLFNVVPACGKAPEILESLPAPHRVFIGGSRGRLQEIIECCAERLVPGGIIVANAILEKTARNAPLFMEKAGLRVDTAAVSVTRKKGSAGPETELNRISIIKGTKRGMSS